MHVFYFSPLAEKRNKASRMPAYVIQIPYFDEVLLHMYYIVVGSIFLMSNLRLNAPEQKVISPIPFFPT